MAQRQRQNPHDKGEGGHQNRSQAQTGSLDGGFNNGMALTLENMGKLDNQNRVLAGQPRQYKQANLREDIIIPTRPSPHDLRAAGATVELADRSDKPFMFVINAATPRARITSDAAIALSQHGTVSPATIHQRTDFASSMIDGRTVMEINPESRSSKEIAELWDYVSDRLEKNFRRIVFQHQAQQLRRTPVQNTGFGRRQAEG